MPPVATQKRRTPPVQAPVVEPPDKKVRIYAAPVLLSAFLLFLVQPMLAKAILPWFGGTASVWIVAMLFFQGMLVVGYGYAYLVNRFLPRKVQPVCHVALLFASLAIMPIAPWRVWHPGAAGDPSFEILRVLFLTVGLPYFLLSTTGPLIQAWYARAERIAFPYRLFALSNLGSLAALLAYPVFIEPFLTTRHQMIAWSVLYGTFVLLAGGTAAQFWRSRPESSTSPAKESKESVAAPARSEYLLWGALAACGSALLVTVMNHLCQNVAPMPLLWVLPLGTYLLTFILCFDRQGWYKPSLLRWVLPVALGTMMLGVFYPENLPAAMVQIPMYLGCLFAGCMFCHGELARRKPHSRYLTSFYLMISLGGALASVAIGLIAPRVSNWQVEFPQALVSCAILGLLTLFPKHWMQRAALFLLMGVLALLTVGIIRHRDLGTGDVTNAERAYGAESKESIVLQARSFYGALTVSEKQESLQGATLSMRTFMHGWISHGTQILGPQLETIPTSYYNVESGAGRVLGSPRNPWNVGVVGLGTGTLAAYGKPGDSFTFFEIDPLVSQIAQSQFSYLKLSQATVKISIGDGRLSLEKEPPQRFNMLVIDAFSGDSIPAHLLTREAFQMYFSKLTANGVIAVHITNRFVDLAPVLAAVSDDLHKQAVVVASGAGGTAGVPATWVLITEDSASLPLPRGTWTTLSRRSRNVEAWTDDYSNIFQLLK